MPAWALLLLGLLAAALPLRTLDAPLLLDDAQILENPDIREVERLPGVFARGYWEGVQGSVRGDQYRPVTLATLNLTFALAGDESPAAYRIQNFALHGLASALLAALAARATGSAAAGLLAGALQAVLPVHADTVAGVIHRGELLAAVFAIGAALLHARARDRGAATWAAASLYALSVLSKESAAALPAALFVLDRVARPAGARLGFRDAARLYGPHLLALLLCLLARVAVLGRIGLEPDSRYFQSESGPVVARTMALFGALHYARPLLLGAPLVADFSRRSFASASPEDPLAWACLLGWAALGAGSLALAWRRRSLPAAGLACALVLALPVSNLFVRTGILGAHRALYLPATGWCLALGALLARRWSAPGRWRAPARTGTLALLGLYALLSFRRGEIGRDRETFYGETLRQVPENALFLYNLGVTWTERGRAPEAEALYRKAIAVDPGFFGARNNLVGVLLEQGKSEEALALAKGLAPANDRERAAQRNAEAVILGRRGGRGEIERALGLAREAVSLAPQEASYRVTVAQALAALGRREEAVEALRQAVRLPAPSRAALAYRERVLALLGTLEPSPGPPGGRPSRP